MFSITNHQENTNQNYDKVALHTLQDNYNLKNQKITKVGEDVEKLEHLYIAAGHLKLCIGYEKWYHKFNFKLTSKF